MPFNTSLIEGVMEGWPRERRVAERLAELYETNFGGKARGRYRFSMKQLRSLTGRKRVPGEVVRKLGEELYELGYVLIDLETYFVVLAQSTFRSYRRVSDSRLSDLVHPADHGKRHSSPSVGASP